MADPKHYITRIVAALALAPKCELLGQIGGRLSGERRIGRAHPLPLRAVAGGAGLKVARSIAGMIELKGAAGIACGRVERQSGVVKGDRLALPRAQLPRYPRHLRMVPAAVGIGLELPFQITNVDPSEPRRSGAVAAAIESMTGEAGVARTRLGATHRDQASIGCEAIERRRLSIRAAGHKDGQRQRNKVAHTAATARGGRLFRAATAAPLLLLLATACKPPPEQHQSMAAADPTNGRTVIERVGCASCHRIPGVGWPKGTVGPPLEGLAARGLIAGKLPNRPDVLAAYVRNAPALVPGSGMPAMPVTASEAHDIAAYLYQQEGR